jgi:hypothetical protein
LQWTHYLISLIDGVHHCRVINSTAVRSDTSKMKVLAGAVFCLVLYTVGGSFTSEYYENLISQRTTQARAYEMPESNAEFQRGASSPETNGMASAPFVTQNLT